MSNYHITHQHIQCGRDQLQIQVLRHEGMFASVDTDDVTGVQTGVCGGGGWQLDVQAAVEGDVVIGVDECHDK